MPLKSLFLKKHPHPGLRDCQKPHIFPGTGGFPSFKMESGLEYLLMNWKFLWQLTRTHFATLKDFQNWGTRRKKDTKSFLVKNLLYKMSKNMLTLAQLTLYFSYFQSFKNPSHSQLIDLNLPSLKISI